MPDKSEIKKDPEIILPWMYRKWEEFPSLFFGILLLFAVTIAFNAFTALIALWLLGLFLVLLLVYLENSNFKSRALLLNKSQLPHLYEIFERVCVRMGMNASEIRLFVQQDPTYNAFAFGIFQKAVIFNSSVVDDFSDDEIEVIMAHELAHLQAGHTIISSFVPRNSQYFSEIFLGFWSRNKEYTCDRAAVAVTKNVPACVRVQLKLAVGSKLSKSIDYSSFGEQIRSVKGDFGVWLAELMSTHPVTTKRIKAILDFSRETLEFRK